MIKKYKFGSPIDTESVVMDFPVEALNANNSRINIFDYIVQDDKVIFTYNMSDSDIIYGLGEANRGINKRGWTYRSFCSDDPCHTEEKSSLYGAHNLIIIDGSVHAGFFFDTSSEIFFDIGYTDSNVMTITAPANNLILYTIDNKDSKSITKEFRQLIGKSYIPPYWAFGYQQCRWSYMNSSEIRNVAKQHRDNNIPLDAIYLDIDYMESYKDFTINKDSFGDFEELINDMKKENIRLVPIIDAAVKIEEGYDVYEEGVKDNHFCKDKDGNNFVAGVWPGRTHFPDFFNKATRDWFGDKYSFLIDKGIDGFWNDMNEPAIFFSEDGLKNAFEHLDECKNKQLSVYEFFSMKDSILNLSNSHNDYNSFYHNIDGKNVCHMDVHNLYGYNMTRSAADAFERNYPDKRFLMHSRSSYIGMHRYSGIWTGDNQSWWSHILLSLKMMPSLNMCGFLYTGSDIGGFGCNSTRDLVLRWLALGIFTPLMRNHAALGTRNQEAYSFGDTEDFKNIINLRYSLIPHLYSEFMKAALNDDMYFKPLAFDYSDDDYARHCEDQILLGDSLMIAPVYQQNAIGRYVYLPEDMLFVKYTDNGRKICTVMPKGHHFIEVALNEVPMFIRPNTVVAFCSPALSTEELDTSKLELTGYIQSSCTATYKLYEDDGISKNYSLNNISDIVISKDSTGSITVTNATDKEILLNIY